ncbi:MAG TPA: FAD-dependent oxidoreductase [Thermoleophilaceae bacterium]|nr:FAD-dependent oxidoreductase [Thermoleophilaceae bacterium]
MAGRSVDFLLIGGGVAAARCARTLREEGAEGSILLVGREPHPPYDRPPLSKGYLRGESRQEDAHAESPDWWDDNGVELLTRTSVMKLDPDARTAKLSSKEEVGFGRALLATGANVRRLRAEGADLEGIHYLRAFGNSDSIREEAKSAERVVLIGGSYIGCEVAASLTAGLGTQCTIVMQEDEVLERSFGPQVAPFFGDVLRSHGIEIHGGDSLERFEGADGRVTRVVTERGLELDCDLVVVGAGVMPDVMLARSGGLELGEAGGVLCSSQLATSLEGVFAAGDMCEYHSPVHGRPLRVEHWDAAAEQGKTAARNMLGQGVDHAAVPYFFSDLADWVSLEYVGPGSGEPVIRGSLEEGSFTAFYVEDGEVTAALSVDRDEEELEAARRFMLEGGAPEPAALADEGSDLNRR